MKMIVGGLAAGTLVLGVAVAGPAHADATNAQFLNDIRAAGFNADKQGTLLTVGRGMCSDMDAGASSASMVNELYHAGALTQDRAQQFVNITISDLCPWNH
jgi:hypothetical protein